MIEKNEEYYRKIIEEETDKSTPDTANDTKWGLIIFGIFILILILG